MCAYSHHAANEECVNCACMCVLESPRSKSYQTSRRGNNSVNSSSSSESIRSPLMMTRQEDSFKEFLGQHVDVAFNKGFDDNVGRNPVAARFEVFSFSAFHKAMMISR